jgi:hypothetical protein
VTMADFEKAVDKVLGEEQAGVTEAGAMFA